MPAHRDLDAQPRTPTESVRKPRQSPGGGAESGDLHLSQRRAGIRTEPAAQLCQSSIGERSDADAIERAGGPESLDQGPNGGIVLRFDVEVRLGEGDEQFLEPEHRFRAAHPGHGYLGPGQLGDQAVTIGHPVQPIIVEGDQDPVCGCVDVGLEISVAERDGRGECRKRVLRVEIRAAAMGEGNRTRVVEERVRDGQPRAPRRLNVPSRRRTARAEIASSAARLAIMAVDSAQS